MAHTMPDIPLPPDLSERLTHAPAWTTSVFLAASTALFLALLGWMAWFEVDRLVYAAGRVEPAGRVKLINHPTGGKITELHVRDGDRVRAGDPLFALSPAVEKAQRDELTDRLQRAELEVARLEAELRGRPFVPSEALAAARPDMVEAERELHAARLAEHRLRRDVRLRQLETSRSELRAAEAEAVTLAETLELEQQQLESVRSLAERGLYPRLKLIELEKQVAASRGRLARARASLAAARAAVSESESALAAFDGEHDTRLMDELAQATATRDRLRRELAAQSTVVEDLVVRAPVAGVVENMRVTATGQSIAANAPVLEIVPVGEEPVVEARVANEDIGELREGMPATIKVRAYDHLRYGSLPGSVRSISADARPAGEGNPPTYRVIVAAARSYLGERPGEREVLPGMLVDVEFHAGRRTILSYLTERFFGDRRAVFSEP